MVNVARAALAAGATRLGIVSALGADARSGVFYNRVKGEMEQQVVSLGYKGVVIARPSLLMGDRDALGQPKRTGEAWAQRVLGSFSALIPAKFRPVLARDVAASLLAKGARYGARHRNRTVSRDARRCLELRAATSGLLATRAGAHDPTLSHLRWGCVFADTNGVEEVTLWSVTPFMITTRMARAW